MVQQVVVDKMSTLPLQKAPKSAKNKDQSEFANRLLQTAKNACKGAEDTAKPENKEVSDLAMCASLGVNGGVFDFVMMQDALQIMSQNQTVQKGVQSELIVQTPTVSVPLVTGTQSLKSPPGGIPIVLNTPLPNEHPNNLGLQEVHSTDSRLAVSLSQTPPVPMQMEELGKLINNSIKINADEVLIKNAVTIPTELLEKVDPEASGSVEKSVVTTSGLVENTTSNNKSTLLETAVQSTGADTYHGLQKNADGQDTNPYLVAKSENPDVLGTYKIVKKNTENFEPIQVQADVQKLPYNMVNKDIEEKSKLYHYAGIEMQKNADDGMAVGPKNTMGLQPHTLKNELPIPEQITQKILAHKVQEKEFVMQLFPKELGQVTVKMVIENSTLIVELCAANPKAQSLILSNAEDIKNILQTQYQRNTQVFVPTAQKDYTEQFQNQNHNQNPHEQPQQKPQDESDKQEIMFTQGFLSALKALENREGR